MSIALPPLPYSIDALEPHISAKTVQLHHEQHEAGYVARVNKLVENTKLANRSLEEIVAAARQAGDQTLFNMAAQAWNHWFYWRSLRPGGGGSPHGAIAELIDRDFGGYEPFAEQLRQTAVGQFGSGWAWVVLDAGRLKVVATSNADLPPAAQAPLLVIDVWEHAYYLDYQQRRAAYVAAVLGNLLSWDRANERLEAGGAVRAHTDPRAERRTAHEVF